jgi:double-strand break repair protein MRE11
LIEFFESVVGTFRITQPGSSVATSLVPGEAVQKKIGILDIKGKNFRLHPVPLTQVRTFVMTELSLREHRADLDPDDQKVDEKLTNLLEEEVQLMVLGARDKAKETLVEARTAGNDAGEQSSTIKYKLQRPDEILVRLRVDHAGFSTINNQRFGAKFVGQIANLSDILLFHRKKDPKLASTVKKQGIKPIAPEELERTNMEDLVKEHLIAFPDGKLNICGEKDLSEALEEFVDKSIVAAIPDIVTDILNKTQKTLIKGRQGEEPIVKDSQILDVLDRDNKSKVSIPTRRSQPTVQTNSTAYTKDSLTNNDETMLEEDMDEDEEALGNDESEVPGVERNKRRSKSSKSSTALQRHSSANNKSAEVNLANPITKPFQRVASDRPKRGATKRKVAYALDDSEDDEFISDDIVDSDDDDVNDDDEFDNPPANKRKGSSQRGQNAKSRTSRTTKKSLTTETSKSSRKQLSKRNDYEVDSDDELRYNDHNSADIDTDWDSAVTRTQRTGSQF